MRVVRNGVGLHVEQVGAGPAVLFHTGGAGDGTMWRHAGYPAALTGYRSLLLDHRGHGRSDAPDSLDQHRLEDYADDVVAVLDAAEAPHAAMIAYSDGLLPSLAVAAQHPDRVAAVIALGALGPPDHGLDDRRARARTIRRHDMSLTVQRIAAGEAEPPPHWLVANLSATDRAMYALELEGWAGAESPWSLLERVPAPTLLIAGSAEEPDAAGNLHAAAARLPRGTAVVLDALTHLQVFWRTDATTPLIQNFLRSNYP